MSFVRCRATRISICSNSPSWSSIIRRTSSESYFRVEGLESVMRLSDGRAAEQSGYTFREPGGRFNVLNVLMKLG
jgi:hypothetical protein